MGVPRRTTQAAGASCWDLWTLEPSPFHPPPPQLPSARRTEHMAIHSFSPSPKAEKFIHLPSAPIFRPPTWRGGQALIVSVKSRKVRNRAFLPSLRLSIVLQLSRNHTKAPPPPQPAHCLSKFLATTLASQEVSCGPTHATCDPTHPHSFRSMRYASRPGA